MGIDIYEKCWRGRDDCMAISCIDAEPHGISEDDYFDRNYTPLSFVCSGRANNPEVEQDIYRLCFKNEATDEMTDNDLQDLTSIMVVVSAALNLDAVQKVNSGVVEIPAAQALEPPQSEGE